MADDEKEREATSTRGVDWEVVQLTASTYAAVPGPQGFGPYDGRNEEESSNMMFMSNHFVFPPSEHENLPIEPEYSEIQSDLEVEDISTLEEEKDGPDRIQFFDNGRSLSVSDMDVEEAKGLQELNLTGEEGSMDVASEPDDHSRQNLYSPKFTKSNEGDKYDRSSLPCEAWWKRHAACMYHNAKEANTFWSIFVAAALMGLVILGNQWRQEKLHLRQLKWHINDERLNRMLQPIGRFKDVLLSSHQR